MTTTPTGTPAEPPPNDDTPDTPARGYQYTAVQAQAERVRYVETALIPGLMRVFQKHDTLRSALLCVAQYWNDEADDAVHAQIIFSELDEPDFAGAIGPFDYFSNGEAPPDPNVPNTRIVREYGNGGSTLDPYEMQVNWDDNFGAIPLWAAFAPENGSQSYDQFQDVYAPAVLIRRDGTFEFHDMLRPWLDGIAAGYSDDE